MSLAANLWVGKAGRIAALMALATIPLLGCTDDLSGPGTFLAVVTPPDGAVAGAVVVELRGRELTQVSGVGATETFTAESSVGVGESGPLRVVVVGSGEPLTFEVEVADAAQGSPAATVVQAVDLANRLVATDRYRVAMHLVR